MGGFGIACVKDTCVPAFLSSVSSIREYYDETLEVSHHLDYIAQWSELTDGVLPNDKKLQKSWSRPINEKIFERLLLNNQPVTKSRLYSCSDHFSGDWLQCLPIKSFGLQLSNEEFRISSCLRLGHPFFNVHKCKCGTDIDNLGIHCFACKRNNGKILRHAMVNEIISRAFKTAACPNVQEPSHLNSNVRPDGITTIPYRCGKSLAWDFTCPHPMVDSALSINTKRGALADNKENKKTRKYSSLAPDYIFSPIAIDSVGAYGRSAQETIKEIGKRTYIQTGNRDATFQLRQRTSVAIQKSNAISITFALKAFVLLSTLFMIVHVLMATIFTPFVNKCFVVVVVVVVAFKFISAAYEDKSFLSFNFG